LFFGEKFYTKFAVFFLLIISVLLTFTAEQLAISDWHFYSKLQGQQLIPQLSPLVLLRT